MVGCTGGDLDWIGPRERMIGTSREEFTNQRAHGLARTSKKLPHTAVDPDPTAFWALGARIQVASCVVGCDSVPPQKGTLRDNGPVLQGWSAGTDPHAPPDDDSDWGTSIGTESVPRSASRTSHGLPEEAAAVNHDQLSQNCDRGYAAFQLDSVEPFRDVGRPRQNRPSPPRPLLPQRQPTCPGRSFPNLE